MPIAVLIQTARLGAADAGVETATDWVGLGLALALVGSFFLGTAILSGNPRDLIQERFGMPRRGLSAIREPIFRRVQLGLGFAFLMAGFGLQLFGRYRSAAVAAEVGPAPFLPAFWIGTTVIAAILLSVVGWWWSKVTFRRYLRAAFRAHPPELEADMELAREVGELFGVLPYPDDTVGSYVARLRQEAGLPARVARPRRLDPESGDSGTFATEFPEARLPQGP